MAPNTVAVYNLCLGMKLWWEFSTDARILTRAHKVEARRERGNVAHHLHPGGYYVARSGNGVCH